MRLSLDGHCIETAARRERARIEARLLELDGPDSALRALGDDLALLTEFLRDTDFATLRTVRPDLDGRAALTVELRRDDAGRITCYTHSSR